MRFNFAYYLRNIKNELETKPKSSFTGLLLRKIISKLRQKINSIRCIIIKDSTFLNREDLYMCSLFPVKIIDRILNEFKPATVLDVGCGTGVSLHYFLKRKIDAVGIENSKLAIKHSKVPERIIRHNLKKEINLERNFDLVWSFEVIEHIHPRFERVFLNTLIHHGNRIVISAAKPGQGGHGHFNEQPREYWIKRFSEVGYSINENMTDCLRNIKEMHAENILVFEKQVNLVE